MSDDDNGKKQARKSTFGKNLAKALKNRAADNKAAPPPKKPPPGGDSFAGRLADKLKATGVKPEAPSQPGAPEAELLGSDQDKLVESSAGSVGSGERVVQEGECIASIAKETGHFCDTIWNDANNAELRQARNDRYVLLPGDRVHVPALREKWEPRQTEVRHRFRRKGWPEKLQFRLLRDGEPRGNEPYSIDVDGTVFQGTTDPEGKLSCPIIPSARRATLRVGVEPDVSERVFLLGGIDPIDQISGVQGRLNNLGFDCGPVDGISGDRTQAALRDYQRSRQLAISGSADEATRRQLTADYGC